MKAFVAVNRKKPLASSAAALLREVMAKSKIEEVRSVGDADVIFTLGGDGTVLANSGSDKPLLGINIGHLGYMTALSSDEIPLVALYGDGKTFEVCERLMLDVTVTRNGECVYSALALNEADITRGGAPLLVDMKLYFNDKLVTSHSADGIIVATPTGSTAYSMSAGGPVMDPSLDALAVTPVCSHNPAKSRCVVVTGSTVIKIVPDVPTPTAVCVCVDGKHGIYLKDGDVVTVAKSASTTKLVKKKNEQFGSLPYVND